MKFFRLDLLTLLISLFIFNSCKNQDTIGLNVNPATKLNGSLIDTATIVVNTIPDAAGIGFKPADSIITSGLGKTPLGYFVDPVFGVTQSDIAAQLNLPNSGPFVLPSGTITVDSAVLVLHYADGFYGDSLTSKYKINVYQLKERPSTLHSYYNNHKWDFDSTTLVGTRTFNARTHDSVSVFNLITGKPDTIIKVAPQLRIPVSKDFINNIIFEAGSTQLSSNVVFQNNVKGLYMRLDKSAMTGAGGTFMFSLVDSLNVYYRNVNGTTIDTTVFSMPLSTHAARIVHSPSSTINTALSSQSTSSNVIYLQGLAGLKAKISFPYLKNLLASAGGNIVINRAELVVTPVPGSTIPYKAQPKLTMYRWDIAHQPETLQDASSGDPRAFGSALTTTFGGFYNGTLKNYHFVITGYLQDLMNGKTTDYGTYLATVDTTNTSSVDVNPTPQTAGRVIAVGTDKNSPYRIKLNIIYTKINK